MRNFIDFGTCVLATAILAGCGGSGGGASTNVNDPAASTLTVVNSSPVEQSPSVVVQNDTANGQVDQTAEPVTDSSVALVDSQADISDLLSDGSTEEVVVSQTDDSNSQPVQSSFCETATATAVSFEDYFTNSVTQILRGTYVPFPAAGFGWDGNKLCDMASSFGVDAVEVLVPYVSQRPDIDGQIATNEWRSAAVAGTSNFETSFNDIDNLLLANVPDYIDGSGYSSWMAMHDGTNLYVHVRTSSDTHKLFLDSDQPWHDDSFEIFIDGDNSKGEEFDGVNDFQISLSADSSTLEPLISGRSAPGLGIFYRSVNKFQSHPIIEVAINLESAGIEIGKPFGFDVHINEDDNGGDRDAKWGWFEKSGFDRSWFNPSVLGTLLLTDCADRNACGRHQQLQP